MTRRTQAPRISAVDAAALVRSGDWVEYGGGIGQPDVFDAALAERVDEIEDVKIRASLTVRPRAVLEVDPGRDHFHWFSWHYTGYDRAKGDSGLATYIPCNLGEIPDYYRRFVEPPEIAVIKTCPKDERGFFNFSLAALWHRAIVERAKLVIVEESAGLPYVDGLENAVHESDVDYIIEGDHGPAPEVPNPPPSDVDHGRGAGKTEGASNSSRSPLIRRATHSSECVRASFTQSQFRIGCSCPAPIPIRTTPPGARMCCSWRSIAAIRAAHASALRWGPVRRRARGMTSR
jgi:Acetyl-CoA hydrolase/transferase N-terminal domain